MRSVAGRDSAACARQSTYGGRVTLTTEAGAVLGDHAVRADAGRNECRLAALERPELAAAAALQADAACEGVQAMRRRRGHVDGEARRRLEVLEPEVLAVDGAAHAGPHALRLDDEFLGASRREIQRLECSVDVEVAQRKPHVVPRSHRRARAPDLERKHVAALGIAERVHLRRRRLAARCRDRAPDSRCRSRRRP